MITERTNLSRWVQIEGNFELPEDPAKEIPILRPGPELVREALENGMGHSLRKYVILLTGDPALIGSIAQEVQEAALLGDVPGDMELGVHILAKTREALEKSPSRGVKLEFEREIHEIVTQDSFCLPAFLGTDLSRTISTLSQMFKSERDVLILSHEFGLKPNEIGKILELDTKEIDKLQRQAHEDALEILNPDFEISELSVSGDLEVNSENASDPDPDSPINLYLSEISRFKLLTAVEEVELAKLIEAGKKAELRLVEDQDDLGDMERQELEGDVFSGQAAFKKMTEANLRLVVSVARKYLGRGVSFLDLIQEGNMGLQKGIEKFDYRRGFRLSTMAYWWIGQKVRRSIQEQSRTIRLPTHVYEQIADLNNAERELAQELLIDPGYSEIADRMHVSEDRVREIERAAKLPVSLEQEVSKNDDENSTLSNFMEDLEIDVEELASNELLTETIREMVADALHEKIIDDRKALVLVLRFGLDGREAKSLLEVAEELDISREWARQLEANALEALRPIAIRKQLKDNLNTDPSGIVERTYKKAHAGKSTRAMTRSRNNTGAGNRT